MPKSNKVRGSIERALVIINAFTITEPEFGVRDLARRLDLSPSTVGRIVSTLQKAGVLSQNPVNRKYRLGAKVLHWAWVFGETFNLDHVALPVMEELREATSETISLYIAQGSHRMCIAWLRSPHAMVYETPPGEPMPLHCGAAGMVLLANLNETEREEALCPERLISYTENSVTDRTRIEQVLERIREQDYAISFGELVKGTVAIAAPVRNARGEVIAVISVSGPAVRLDEDTARTFLERVVEAAKRISSELGNLAEPGNPKGALHVDGTVLLST